MLRRVCRLGTFAAAVLFLSAVADAAITRVAGPATLVGEPKGFFKFDSAYDSQNRVYLAVWGTQLAGPVNGMLLNESGVPVTGVFPLSDGLQQSGWARVIYSAERRKFLISYVRILGPQVHQKVARFVTVTNNIASPGPEKVLDEWSGDSGTASGMAYSAAAGRFLVTWSHYAIGPSGLYVANSFVRAIDADGNLSATKMVSDSFDGESDPEIACDPVSRKCLVIGTAWGIGTGGRSSFWARYVDDTTGEPFGTSVTYVAVWGGLMDPPAVAHSPATSQFLMGIGMGGEIHGILGNGSAGSLGSPFQMLKDTTSTAGIGYGFLSMRYNTGSQTILASMTTWLGYAALQEFDGAGVKMSGGFDLVPDTPERTGGNDQYSTANQFAIVVPNSVTSGALLLENHFFKAIRSSVYSGAGGAPLPPPPPPPPPGVSISALNPSHVLPAQVGTSVTWTATASGGGSSLLYQFERWRSGTDWQIVRSYAASPSAVILALAGNQAVRVSVKTTTSSAAVDAQSNPVFFVAASSRALSLDAVSGGDVFAYHSGNGGGYMLSGDLGVLNEVNYGNGWGAGNRVITADFNGDGLSDLLTYNPASGYTLRAINAGNNNFTFTDYGWATGLTLVAGDFNGDGRDDIFTYSKSTGAWTKQLTDAGWAFQQSSGTWSRNWEVYTGDFDGDGVADLFVYNKTPGSADTGRYVRVLNAPNGNFAAYVEGSLRWWTGWTVHPGDFDGDTKTDLMLYGTDGRWYKVFFPTNAGPERYVNGQWSLGWLPRVGDFNGDRKDDVFVYNQATGTWFVVISTGDSWAYYQGTTWAGGFVPTVTDINRDGLADLIVYNPSDGRWFQIISSANPAQFGYYTGPDMETGLQIIASISR